MLYWRKRVTPASSEICMISVEATAGLSVSFVNLFTTKHSQELPSLMVRS
ncbi:hypothetical protein PPTG_20762 [Phytophthora nicotianae INRA-310]|uniref:Uncharacterized protein n=1 Tax=Phytophthora nicotianae (strain INRA-310) TaxID=761204 RepID=W2RHM3_PHYN3|nr:hypothetical protein PPTG_20762 [Phytophthora nicotianae INRA-310]ETN24164.1 hypothetical protein PPTG_20762 [Phytophthora nicotianae INRA-310]